MEGRESRRDGGRGPHVRPNEAEAERLLADRLTDGPIEESDRAERVRASLPPKYEVRIRTEHDPVVEETKRYRGMAREIELPSPINPPSGCRYHTRCPLASERCRREQPQLRQIGEDRYVACHDPLGAEQLKSRGMAAEGAG